MLILQAGDRIELRYEDAVAPPIRATVDRLETDRQEGLGIEAESYIASWIEIRVEESNDPEAKQVVLLGMDLQYRFNGRPVSVRKRQD